MPPFDTDPFTVITVKRSMITVDRKGKQIARNAFVFNRPTSTTTKSATWQETVDEPWENVGTLEGRKPVVSYGRDRSSPPGQDDLHPLSVEYQ